MEEQSDHTTEPQGDGPFEFEPEDNAANPKTVGEVLDEIDKADKAPPPDEAESDEVEQQLLDPSFEPPDIPEIKKAAKAYVKARDARVKASAKETSTNAVLAEAMQNHEAELPRRRLEGGIAVMVYPLGDGTEAIVVPTKLKVKVKATPDADED